MSSVIICQPGGSRQLNDFKKLLEEYGELRNYDEALGNYREEVSSLPGIYANPEGCMLIAYFNNKPAGIVAYKKIGEGICEMKRLFVKTGLRGKDIGRKLVAELLNRARRNKYRLMKLDTHPWMDAAHGLYKEFGFVETERYNDNPTKGIRFFELKL